jgi:hypothetical protein
MLRYKWLNLAVIALFMFSCGKSLPELEGIDQQVWKEDRNGCAHKREPMAAAIKKEKNKLLALNELEIIKVLGKPDRNELFKRNQKFYHYFLEPADECASHGDEPLRLSIRFNAMGLAKEIVVE